MAGEPAKAAGSARSHSTLPVGGGKLGWGGVEESCALRPLPTGPGSGSWQAKAASPGHVGYKRPRERRDRMGASQPPSSARGASPRGSRPSAFPPWYLAALGGFRTPGGRGGAGRGLSPGLCELSSALPAYLRGGAAVRCARWVVRLEQTLGSPGSQHPWVLAPPRRDHKWSYQCTSEHPPPPPSSRTSRARLSLTVLQSSRGGGEGSAPGASVHRRGQPGLGSPLSGPARLQITTWLAAGAPKPARRRPLQLVAKFMPAALQWRPQSARSIPTARLRAVRPEGGVSGV